MNTPMEKALALAATAAEHGEVPIGCVIVSSTGELIGSAHNEVEATQNPLRHAECIAIERALAKRGTKYLEDCDLYVTLEPCAMCAGAIASVRLRRVYFGAYDPKSGGTEHGARVLAHSHHTPEIIGGLMESSCALLLTGFFQERR